MLLGHFREPFLLGMTLSEKQISVFLHRHSWFFLTTPWCFPSAWSILLRQYYSLAGGQTLCLPYLRMCLLCCIVPILWISG
jgi:hypothetical protein